MAQQTTALRSNSIKQQLIKAAEELKEDARKNAKHIEYESFGTDKNKKKKNQKSCDRGSSSGPARYCSRHIRQIYKNCIIGDNEESEWCVCSRHAAQCCINNPCHLCNINTQHFTRTQMVNFAEAISSELDGNNNNTNVEKYQRRLLSFMLSHIGSNYPGTGGESSVLRIKVNGEIWSEYYIKLTAFSSLLKTSAPSGYKYKDRISLGRMIRIQAKRNDNLFFYITKDERYNDAEFEEKRPVVNGVGFWDLLKPAKDGSIRNIIHINNDQAVHVSFGFLINNPNNIRSIDVELVCTRHSLSMNNTVLPLWKYNNNNISNHDNNNGNNYNNINNHNVNTVPISVPIPIPIPIPTAPNHQFPTGFNNYNGYTYYIYTPTHSASQTVEQQRYSPLYRNEHSYPPMINPPFFDDDSSENQSTNIFDPHMFDDTTSMNGFMFNTDLMFSDNISTIN